MKKILLIIMVFPLMAMAQSQPDGALGLEFGMSPDSCKIIMKKSGVGKMIRPSAPDGNGIRSAWIFNANALGIKGNMIRLSFYNNMLCTIGLIIKSESHDNIYGIYKTVNQSLIDKYGTPTDSTHEISRKYEESIKNESESNRELSISQGLETLGNSWSFFRGNKITTLITLDINDEDVLLIYGSDINPSLNQKGEKIDTGQL